MKDFKMTNHDQQRTDLSGSPVELKSPEATPSHLPPSALARFSEIQVTLGHRLPAFFLDFDGTLTPIVSHPEMVSVSTATDNTLRALGARYPVCVVSGRDLPNLRKHLRVPNIYYAGDHGHRLEGPKGSGIELKIDARNSDELMHFAQELRQELHGLEGVILELKQTSLSVHHRLASDEARALVEKAVQDAVRGASSLCLRRGKMVLELRPCHPWNKGSVVGWLLEKLGLDKNRACPICIGDDLTDEDMYEAVAEWGIGIVVAEELDRPTQAKYSLRNPDEVLEFLGKFL
ncbi:MAG: trehalose-phosphatase [Thermoleophilia bacterium]|nr:trehalose-phosphatase [Thermoleophilia bacterium]